MSAKPDLTNFRASLFVRSFVGLMLAPTVGTALVFAIMAFGAYAYNPAEYARVVGIGAICGLAFGGPGALVLGWPVHLLLLKKRWTSLWVYLGLGAGLGVLGFFVGMAVGAGVDIAGLSR